MEAKNNPYLGQELNCPICGEMTKAADLFVRCTKCRGRIMDVDSEGNLVFLDPEKLDKSKPYKIHGMVDVEARTHYTEKYPGEIVTLTPPVQMTDVSVIQYVDGVMGIEKFVMPERDVLLTSESHGMTANSSNLGSMSMMGSAMMMAAGMPNMMAMQQMMNGKTEE